MSNTLDDFFGTDDRHTTLGRQIAQSMRARGFHPGQIGAALRNGDTSAMTQEERALYAEWKPLDDEIESFRRNRQPQAPARQVPPSEWALREGRDDAE
jgi:hypothetical protein